MSRNMVSHDGQDSVDLRDRFAELMDDVVANGDLLAPLQIRHFVDMAVDRLFKLRPGRQELVIRHLGHVSSMALNSALAALQELNAQKKETHCHGEMQVP